MLDSEATTSKPLDCKAAWRELLGPERAQDDPALLDRYQRSTSPKATRPAIVLYPKTTAEVSRIMVIAQEGGHPVYPISCGRNWGYGDAAATEESVALIDLSAMNRIIEIDATLGYAIIEPGVTQRQLYEAVRVAAPQFWIDATGAGDGASVMGNALVRGFGHTPYADHVRSASTLEVVLPNGEILNTGLGHFPNAKAAHVFPYGTGPGLDGLFFQSNLGIVTRMTLWLYPAPAAFTFFYIPVQKDGQLPGLIDALRPLRLNGTLNSAIHLGNDLRVISAHETYPWEASNGVTPLPPALRAQLRQESGVAPWNVSGSLAGSPAQVNDAARQLRRALKPLGLKPLFLNDRRLDLAQRALGFVKRFGLGKRQARQLDALLPNYGLLKGIPTNSPLEATRWRLRKPVQAPIETDPRELGCGLIWLSPLLPMTGKHAQAVLDIVEPLLARHGFDLLITFTSLNERTLVAVISISYDRQHPGDEVAAISAYEEGFHALTAAGYYPYRSPLIGMKHLCSGGDSFWTAAQAIKTQFDPQDLLARGHYLPPLPSRASTPPQSSKGPQGAA